MKRLFLLPVLLFALCSISLGADFAPSVSLTEAKETSYIKGIGTVIDKVITSRSESFLKEKFELIHKKIGILFDAKAKLKNDDIFVLEFIDRKIVQWLNAYMEKRDSAENTTNTTTTSSSSPKQIDPDDYTAGAKTIVIDKISGPVVKFKVVAELEDIEVESFTLRANNTTFDNVVEKVYAFDSEGKSIGEDRPSDDVATFDDSFTLKQGTNYIYIALEPFDDDTSNTTYTFSLEITKAKGKTSKQDIDAIITTNTEDRVSIVPVSIGSIQLLNAYQGYFVDERMYNLAKADLAIISFSPEASHISDTIFLRNLEFTIQDDTQEGHIANTLHVQRIDTQSAKIPVDNINDNHVSFDLTNFGGKAEVKPGTTVILLVTGTPTLDPSKSESVSIELDSSDTTHGIISYSTQQDSAIIGTAGLGYIGSIGVSD